MYQFIDHVMALHVTMIAAGTLLVVVWLAFRVGDAAIVLCHSAGVFARSLAVGFAKASSSTPPCEQPAEFRIKQPAEFPQTAGSVQQTAHSQSAESMQPADKGPVLPAMRDALPVTPLTAPVASRPVSSPERSAPFAKGSAKELATSPTDTPSPTTASPPCVQEAPTSPSRSSPVTPTAQGSAAMPTTPPIKSVTCHQGSALSSPDRLPAPVPAKPRHLAVSQAGASMTMARRRQRSTKKPAVKKKLPATIAISARSMSAEEAPEITHAFHRWMVDRRQTGKRIAVDDVWVKAQEFAHAQRIRLPKENRFREFLARTPGVTREYDVRLDGDPKTTTHTFSPTVLGIPQDEFMNRFDSAVLLNSR